MFPFYTPWKYQKRFGFLVFSKGVNWEHWLEMDECNYVTIYLFTFDKFKFPVDLVTFTEEILNGKLQFLWSASVAIFK